METIPATFCKSLDACRTHTIRSDLHWTTFTNRWGWKICVCKNYKKSDTWQSIHRVNLITVLHWCIVCADKPDPLKLQTDRKSTLFNISGSRICGYVLWLRDNKKGDIFMRDSLQSFLSDIWWSKWKRKLRGTEHCQSDVTSRFTARTRTYPWRFDIVSNLV